MHAGCIYIRFACLAWPACMQEAVECTTGRRTWLRSHSQIGSPVLSVWRAAMILTLLWVKGHKPRRNLFNMLGKHAILDSSQ